MRIEGIQTGDFVEVDHNGRRFYAIVIGPAPGGLSLRPKRSDEPALEPARERLDRDIGAIVRTWVDNLAEALATAYEPQKARLLFERYRDAFSEGYRDDYPPASAVADIRMLLSGAASISRPTSPSGPGLARRDALSASHCPTPAAFTAISISFAMQ